MTCAKLFKGNSRSKNPLSDSTCVHFISLNAGQHIAQGITTSKQLSRKAGKFTFLNTELGCYVSVFDNRTSLTGGYALGVYDYFRHRLETEYLNTKAFITQPRQVV